MLDRSPPRRGRDHLPRGRGHVGGTLTGLARPACPAGRRPRSGGPPIARPGLRRARRVRASRQRRRHGRTAAASATRAARRAPSRPAPAQARRARRRRLPRGRRPPAAPPRRALDAALRPLRPRARGDTTQVNADLLLVHAVAARHGHAGRRATTRARARSPASSPARRVWRTAAAPDPRSRGPGWRAAPDCPNLHPVFDSRGRRRAGAAPTSRATCSASTPRPSRASATRSRASPPSRDWRWPALRLNQFNWYCAMFAADATVNGAARRARRRAGAPPRALPRRRCRRRGAPATSAPGCASTTCPRRAPRRALELRLAPSTRTSCSGFSRHYGQARGGRDAAARAARRCCATGCGARSPATGRTAAT